MSILEHLWQSTLCAGVAGLLAIALRRSSAGTRHAIWLAASLKFLVPLSLFVAAGAYLAAGTASVTTSRVTMAIRWLDQSLPFWTIDVTRVPSGTIALALAQVDPLALILIWAAGAAALVVWRWRQCREASRLARSSIPLDHDREAQALRRVADHSRISRPIDLRLCQAGLEPAVFGVWRPRLLWPTGLSDRLSDAELTAILAHEMSHVNRRDNLTALIHMVVETVFWFHPLVWWIGARLTSERERACDEEVLRMGIDNRSYAEGIVKVCRFCLRAPAALMAGVGSSHLAARIERIIRTPIVMAPTVRTRLLLALVVIVAAGAPMAVGASYAHRTDREVSAQAQRREDGVTQPMVVYDVKPRYTREALDAKIQGSVGLEAVVLETGAVGEVTVVRSLDSVYGLDDQAVLAMKQWRFEPGTKDKKPVAVRVEVEMTFRLK
jgi:TonB family protein